MNRIQHSKAFCHGSFGGDTKEMQMDSTGWEQLETNLILKIGNGLTENQYRYHFGISPEEMTIVLDLMEQKDGFGLTRTAD